MTFITAREIFDPYVNDELGNFGTYTSYKIFQENNFVGEFLYKNIVSSFSTPQGSFIIVSKNELLRPAKYFLKNKNTDEQLAEFKFSFWRQIFHNEIGRINLGDSSFVCGYSKPSVYLPSFFCSESDASMVFSLQGGDTIISYRAIYKILNDGETDSYKPYKDCVVEISISDYDVLLMYLGLFLIERFFRNR